MLIKSATVVIIMLVFAAIGVYLVVGDARTIDADMARQMPQAAIQSTMQSRDVAHKPLPAVEDMLQQLEQRLEREPEDAQGWSLLGRSYKYLGRAREAEKAFARAAALGYQRPVADRSGAASVRGVVRLDPSLASNIAGSETVFIFARAVSGPRVPLAVMRRTANELPIEFELNDSMSVTSEYKLSSFNKIVIGARLSAAGDASASKGDMEGYSSIVDVNSTEEIDITIDQSVLVRAAGSAGDG